MPSTPTSTFCGETVAMHQVDGANRVVPKLVSRVQTRERIERDAQSDRDGQTLAALRGASQEARQRVALDVLHHEVVTDGAGPRPRGWERRSGDGCAPRCAPHPRTSPRTLFRSRGVDGAASSRRNGWNPPTPVKRARNTRRHAAGRKLADELIAIDTLPSRARVEELRHSARTFRAPRRSRHRRWRPKALC